MTIAALHQRFLEAPRACTDSRAILENSVFFALKGGNFNGNTFAAEALAKGARYAIIDEARFKTSDNTILVPNVLESLQQLASYHRKYFAARVIALTGSNGKTTTKELIRAVLSKKYRTISTLGNLNNHIGVPLTLLSIKADTEFAVVEMGANHLEEITLLCRIAQPDFGYITNFGKAHLEGFGNEAGVVKGKSELYEYLIASNRPVFLNGDDDKQRELLKAYPNKIGYSRSDTKFYTIKFLGATPYVSLEAEGVRVESQLIGSYNFTNCCAALLIGKYFNIELSEIKQALESYLPSGNRSQVMEKGGRRIILDAYNANPTSMQAALENLEHMEGTRLAILGDMFELGPASQTEHQGIADLAAGTALDDVYLIGEHFARTRTALKKFPRFEDLKNYLQANDIEQHTILIKGSRGMALERIIELL